MFERNQLKAGSSTPSMGRRSPQLIVCIVTLSKVFKIQHPWLGNQNFDISITECCLWPSLMPYFVMSTCFTACTWNFFSLLAAKLIEGSSSPSRPGKKFSVNGWRGEC